MNKLLLAAALFFSSANFFAQNEPYGFSLSNDKFNELETIELETFNHSVLLQEDTDIERNGGRSNFGRMIPFFSNENNSGTWTQLANGDKIWQIRVKTSGAQGICVYFNDLFLPIGSSLVFYPADRSYFVGPFGNHDCNSHGHFMAGEVLGDEGVLEYYEPATVVGDARIGIRGIAHLYRWVYDYRNEDSRGGGSEACEVDVNCPEGLGWEQQRDAVVRLQIVSGSNVGLCSGSLVNTTSKDCRKYILTAMHCGEDVSDDDWLDCGVRFKYQRAACTSGSTPSTNNKIGVFHLADSNDGGGATGSDFLLLELEDEIPSSWNPFFAGWNAETTAANSGVSIHHPAGDRKKISTTDNIVSGTYNATGYHWRVIWMETETNWGVTEGGSSGSPLFDQNHRIVGTLTGGLSFCDNPDAPDYYGKMSRHWTSNPNPANQKLKVWLDPDDTGVLTLDGSYVHDGAALPCDPSIISVNESLEFADLKIYPSLTNEQLTITTEKFRNIAEVRIFDNSGKVIENVKLSGLNTTLNTGSYSNGIYFISFIDRSGSFVTQKFAVQH